MRETRKGKDKATYVREKTLRSGERLKRRTQRKRQLRTVELLSLPTKEKTMRACQLRTVDRESADDRLTSATEKTSLDPDGRLERLQRRRQREGQM